MNTNNDELKKQLDNMHIGNVEMFKQLDDIHISTVDMFKRIQIGNKQLDDIEAELNKIKKVIKPK